MKGGVGKCIGSTDLLHTWVSSRAISLLPISILFPSPVGGADICIVVGDFVEESLLEGPACANGF